MVYTLKEFYKAEIYNYPKTNFEMIMQCLTPDVLAVLLSESVSYSSCAMCTKKHMTECDRQCTKHVKEWLSKEPNTKSTIDILRLVKEYANNSDSIMKEE